MVMSQLPVVHPWVLANGTGHTAPYVPPRSRMRIGWLPAPAAADDQGVAGGHAPGFNGFRYGEVRSDIEIHAGRRPADVQGHMLQYRRAAHLDIAVGGVGGDGQRRSSGVVLAAISARQDQCAGVGNGRLPRGGNIEIRGLARRRIHTKCGFPAQQNHRFGGRIRCDTAGGGQFIRLFQRLYRVFLIGAAVGVVAIGSVQIDNQRALSVRKRTVLPRAVLVGRGGSLRRLIAVRKRMVLLRTLFAGGAGIVRDLPAVRNAGAVLRVGGLFRCVRFLGNSLYVLRTAVYRRYGFFRGGGVL